MTPHPFSQIPVAKKSFSQDHPCNNNHASTLECLTTGSTVILPALPLWNSLHFDVHGTAGTTVNVHFIGAPGPALNHAQSKGHNPQADQKGRCPAHLKKLQ
ncbi:hypothetical protein RvY_17957 [Ramazzottius varieornatus]|uniref:Uncharacterized protein n=1 Tax=Ramazzottius varieornatus TaxID=947166 RepID=A0A1D1W5Y1_RAMVA|nr:hypothetical protein RvY_17957 [Ramazzottius varieornatus]